MLNHLAPVRDSQPHYALYMHALYLRKGSDDPLHTRSPLLAVKLL